VGGAVESSPRRSIVPAKSAESRPSRFAVSDTLRHACGVPLTGAGRAAWRLSDPMRGPGA
jgi:hypothetical protein